MHDVVFFGCELNELFQKNLNGIPVLTEGALMALCAPMLFTTSPGINCLGGGVDYWNVITFIIL